MNITILVATHKRYWMPSDKIYLPLHVGAEGKAPLPYTPDNTGRTFPPKIQTTVKSLVFIGHGRISLLTISDYVIIVVTSGSAYIQMTWRKRKLQFFVRLTMKLSSQPMTSYFQRSGATTSRLCETSMSMLISKRI